MATTTPNFGWPVPTSTDLVKNGATAIEALGDSIDASMLDLKGGTTGQVLSKTTNTDMDFTWVTTDDANAIQNSIVDAKGDLISATANDTPARLAVGNNGETLVADSSTSTGLRYNPQNALVNPIINGGMDIWQRGTSIPLTTSTYGPDRWLCYRGASGSTVTRQTVSDTTNLPNIQYATRLQRDSGNTSTTDIYFSNSFETVNSIPFAGKTITFSFYARRGANYSHVSNAISTYVSTGTGTDQNRITAGYTGGTDIINQQTVLTTTWQRFAITATVPTTSTEIATWFTFTPIGTAGANDYVEITGTQIDIGTYTASTAPTFRRTGGTIQGELAACQRYYYRTTAGANYEGYSIGMGSSSTNVAALFPLKQTMSSAPYAVDYGGSIESNSPGAGAVAITAIALGDSGLNQITINCTSASGITSTRPYIVRSAGNTTSYIGFSAEL